MHISLGLFIIAIVKFLPYYQYLLIIGFLCTLLCSLLSKRGIHLPIITWLFDVFEREDEHKGVRAKGFLFFVLGSVLSALLFPQDITLASIAILTFGDSISHFFWPHAVIKHPLNQERMLEGMLAGILAGALAGWVFVPFALAFLGAFTAMFVEALEIEVFDVKVDDNLYIPLLAGAVMILIITII
ncbi:MAG: hypothetical protein ACQESE_03240 [Nanobdellota archaeon]